MKPGDLVKQAPNIFANREIGGQKMLIVEIDTRPYCADHHWALDRVTVLFDGQLLTWHRGELEKAN